MAANVNPIPEGFHTITPLIVVRNAADAIEFYKKAFGAEEIERNPGPDGKGIMHAEVKIGDSILMLCDEFPGCEGWASPASFEGTTVTLHLYVSDVDAVFKRAVEEGCSVKMPVMDTFWGDRYGQLADPFGHRWSVASRVKTLTPEQIAQGAEEFFKNMPECGK
ncbi:MAG: VOC family protein [Planctomycetota bacterium]